MELNMKQISYEETKLFENNCGMNGEKTAQY